MDFFILCLTDLYQIIKESDSSNRKIITISRRLIVYELKAINICGYNFPSDNES